jgi:hypothetical protein
VGGLRAAAWPPLCPAWDFVTGKTNSRSQSEAHAAAPHLAIEARAPRPAAALRPQDPPHRGYPFVSLSESNTL